MAPKLISNKKLIGGGLLVAAIGAVLSMMNGWFPGLGGGLGTGGTDVQISTSTQTEKSPALTQVLDTSGLLDIVIDGENYLLKDESGQQTVITIEEIVIQVPQMGGNPDGVLIQIARKRSSLFSAERALEDQLRESGIKDEQIDWVQEVVD